jgi:hypothetical protein
LQLLFVIVNFCSHIKILHDLQPHFGFKPIRITVFPARTCSSTISMNIDFLALVQSAFAFLISFGMISVETVKMHSPFSSPDPSGNEL